MIIRRLLANADPRAGIEKSTALLQSLRHGGWYGMVLTLTGSAESQNGYIETGHVRRFLSVSVSLDLRSISDQLQRESHSLEPVLPQSFRPGRQILY